MYMVIFDHKSILIMNETVRILDFDWADTENTAEYSPELKLI